MQDRSEALKLQHRARLILEFFDFLPHKKIRELERRTTYLHVLRPRAQESRKLDQREKIHEIWQLVEKHHRMLEHIDQRQGSLERAQGDLQKTLEDVRRAVAPAPGHTRPHQRRRSSISVVDEARPRTHTEQSEHGEGAASFPAAAQRATGAKSAHTFDLDRMERNLERQLSSMQTGLEARFDRALRATEDRMALRLNEIDPPSVGIRACFEG